MTAKEKLLEEFNAAIIAVLGDNASEEFDIKKISKSDLISIANKVAFYLEIL